MLRRIQTPLRCRPFSGSQTPREFFYPGTPINQSKRWIFWLKQAFFHAKIPNHPIDSEAFINGWLLRVVLGGLESHHFRAKGHGKNQCGCRVGQARSQRVLPKLLKGRFPELQQDVVVPIELSFGVKCPI